MKGKHGVCFAVAMALMVLGGCVGSGEDRPPGVYRDTYVYTGPDGGYHLEMPEYPQWTHTKCAEPQKEVPVGEMYTSEGEPGCASQYVVEIEQYEGGQHVVRERWVCPYRLDACWRQSGHWQSCPEVYTCRYSTPKPGTAAAHVDYHCKTTEDSTRWRDGLYEWSDLADCDAFGNEIYVAVWP